MPDRMALAHVSGQAMRAFAGAINCSKPFLRDADSSIEISVSSFPAAWVEHEHALSTKETAVQFLTHMLNARQSLHIKSFAFDFQLRYFADYLSAMVCYGGARFYLWRLQLKRPPMAGACVCFVCKPWKSDASTK